MTKRVFKVGSRRSALAIAQTEQFLDVLRERLDGAYVFELVPLQSRGDKEVHKHFTEFTEKGIFTHGLREPLVAGELDFLVHSAKDLSVKSEPGYRRPLVLPRGRAEDVLVTKEGRTLATLPQGATVGTGSQRRKTQLLLARPDLNVVPLRGSVETRMQKVFTEVDAVVLAAAGLERINALQNPPEGLSVEILSFETMLPAPAQGFLVAEVTEQNTELYALLKALEDPRDRLLYDAECRFMQGLGANCQAPCAAYARYENCALMLTGLNAQGGPDFTKRANVELLSAEEVATFNEPYDEMPDLLIRRVDRALRAFIGEVYLIGAGPGDPELLTIKAADVLQRADVIVLDRLGTMGLQHLFAPDALRIDVGKHAHVHRVKQEEIQEILIRHARAGKVVARLKGGDPFVFGRGGEEILRLKEEHIPYTVIPGITSAIAVPELAGIPVTHRDLAAGFEVLSGHRAREFEPCENEVGYQVQDAEVTKIYLMGMSHLEEIVAHELCCGRDPQTPAAIIQEGTTANEKRLVATLETLVDKASTEGYKAPAIIIIGEVVSLADELYRKEDLPLSGRSIWLSKALTEDEDPRADLAALGAAVTWEPLIRFVQTAAHVKGLIEAMNELFANDDEHLIAFSSPRAVTAFFKALQSSGHDLRVLGKSRFAVCGTGTARRLRHYGVCADIVPEEFNSEAMIRAMIQNLESPQNVMLVHSERGRRVLRDELKAKSKMLYDVAAYTSESVLFDPFYFRRLVKENDTIVLSSPSAVQAYNDNLKALRQVDPDFTPESDLIAYGAVTANAMLEHDLPIAAIAAGSTASLITELLRRPTDA